MWVPEHRETPALGTPCGSIRRVGEYLPIATTLARTPPGCDGSAALCTITAGSLARVRETMQKRGLRTLTHDMMLTDPLQAKDFVRRTGVDALAIAIGTSHCAYKFTRQPTGDILDIDRIAQIHAAVPATHLVMHGSSSVPQEWLAIIREHGGDIKATYGVPVEEIRRGIQSGVRKVNIDTDIRLAMTGAMRQSFSLNPSEFDPRKALIAAKKAAKALCRARFEAFGCAGHADSIVPIALESMIKRYH